MKKKLFTNAVIHTGKSIDDAYAAMLVEGGIIKALYKDKYPEISLKNIICEDMHGKHVYPCLIDAHIHMLLTIAVMAMGFNACEITSNGVEPNTIKGVETRLREYAAKQDKDAIIACNNYILTAIDEKRMPTKQELDEWCGARAVVIYNIDGHSTSLSSKMLEFVGVESDSGVLQGEENERAQGRIISTVSSMITLPLLAKGIAKFQNSCAAYGISVVGALEGNGDSKKDLTTLLISKLARHFDVGVRLYLQYVDLNRVRPYEKIMKHLRVGGCGDWEMDGATGSHSAAFYAPFKDTGKTSPCYYTQEFVDNLVKEANERGYQIASHAIGDRAIERILEAYSKIGKDKLMRIEHCEFMNDESFKKISDEKYAIMMQPGYAWIDKRYLHTYEQFLPEEITRRMKLKSLYENGVIVCGSSDSPVQDMDPYLQMLGMVQFYNPQESLNPYEAFKCYTENAAKSILEFNERGTLEENKVADFFISDVNFFKLDAGDIVSFRPKETYYGGEKYAEKNGTIGEFICMMFKKKKLI